MSRGFHLAQVNVARMRGPLDDPVMAGFVARLDEVNALADGSEGFVWRLQTEDGDATSLRVFDDSAILINLSVWESVEALKRFVYGGAHLEVLKSKKHWFEKFGSAYLTLWWVPAGHRPSVEEAKERLETLARSGPGPEAFTFSQICPPPG